MKHLNSFLDFNMFSILESTSAQAVKDVEELEKEAQELGLDTKDPKVLQAMCQQALNKLETGDKDPKINLKQVQKSVESGDGAKPSVNEGILDFFRNKKKKNEAFDKENITDTKEILEDSRTLSIEELTELFENTPSDREEISIMLKKVLKNAKSDISDVDLPVYKQLIDNQKVTDEDRKELKDYVQELLNEFARDRQSFNFGDEGDSKVKSTWTMIKANIKVILERILKVLSWLLSPLLAIASTILKLLKSALIKIMRMVGLSHRATSMVGSMVPAFLTAAIMFFLYPIVISGTMALTGFAVVSIIPIYTTAAIVKGLSFTALLSLAANFFKCYKLRYSKGELLFLGLFDELIKLKNYKGNKELDSKTRDLLENIDRSLERKKSEKK